MFKALLIASRPKTLALALAGPIVAAAMASIMFHWDKKIFFWHVLTTILLQVLSNFANDYGDFVKGTDQKAERKDRALAAGMISRGSMKNVLKVTAGLTLVSGLILLNQSFSSNRIYFFSFFLLGIAAIAAAIKYTVGKSPYGYRSLGDIMVFLFFGPVAIAGGFYLHTHSLNLDILLLASAFGLLSVGVLNINNIRDIESDLASKKKTIANTFGKAKAITYQRVLLFTAWILNVVVLFSRQIAIWGGHKPEFRELSMLPMVFLPFLILYMFHLSSLKNCETRAQYNAQLRNLSLFTLALAIYWAGINSLLFKL